MSKKRGRKIHNFYENLHFINKKLENGRTAAQCILCNMLLKNTGIERLILHRKKCHPDSLTDTDFITTSNTDTDPKQKVSVPEKLLLEKKQGRKFNNSFENLQYLNVKTDSGKTVAQCMICKAIMKNTSVERLQIHRKRCHASSSENQKDSSTSSLSIVSETNVKRGRKLHNSYKDLKFVNTKIDNGRTAAQCTICNIVLKNTGIDRLKSHRRKCNEFTKKTNEQCNAEKQTKRKGEETTEELPVRRKRRIIEPPDDSSSEVDDLETNNEIHIQQEALAIEETSEELVNFENIQAEPKQENNDEQDNNCPEVNKLKEEMLIVGVIS